LFEFLVLDGAQAGLSWITILKRRDNYRRAFDGFNPEKMAAWTDDRIETLLQDSGIIRNRAKVCSARQNARAFLQVVQETGSFDQYLWSFVGGRTKVNAWKTMADIPAETAESQAMSRDLKKRGFTFVGPTICYAFMQAAGLVNDHLVDCFRYKEVGNHLGASAKKK
jgi:DNA-3-methyladenine glycosylase I